MRLNNNNFKLYLNYISYYKPMDFNIHRRLDVDPLKFSLSTISHLLLYSSFFKSVDINLYKIANFVALPKHRRSFTLVKGPNGHKFGKYVYGYSYYRFLLLLKWPLNYFVNNELFSNDYLNFFFFLQTIYMCFSNNIFKIYKCKFISNVSINFL